MKRSIETLGILFVFAFFCPFSAEAVTSGNGYAYENGEGNGYAYENGESYAYKWSGEPGDISPKYSYKHTYKYGYGLLDGDLLDKITRMEFRHAFKNQGLEQGPFELMRMEGFHRPEDTPVRNRWGLGDNPHPVPEPCTMLLLALGGPLLLSRRKR